MSSSSGWSNFQDKKGFKTMLHLYKLKFTLRQEKEKENLIIRNDISKIVKKIE